MKYCKLFCSLFGFALVFLSAPFAHTAVFVIPDGDVTALRNAISASNTNGEDDTIELATNGTYVITSPNYYYDGFTALPGITADNGRNLQVHGNGSTIQRSTAQGTSRFRILYLGSGSSAIISELTIANGFIGEGGSALYGGGIYNSNASLTLRNCVVSGNTVGVMFSSNAFGGAIYNEGSLTIENSTLSGNSAATNYGFGGVIFNNTSYGVSSVNVRNCLFTGNSAGRAGCIYNQNFGGENALVTVSNSTFINNSAGSGGVIFNYIGSSSAGPATVTIEQTTLKSNIASYSGGAIFNWGTAVMISNSAIDDNTATNSGGGIYNYAFASFQAVNCTLSGNSSSQGGAIYNWASVMLANCTVAGNSASDGGAVYNYYFYSPPPSVVISGTIFKTGTSGQNIYNSGGTVLSHGYNVSNDDGGGFLAAIGDQVDTDPMLDPAGLQNNGGPTQTIALLLGSPAIDAGDPNSSTRDQRYYLRNGPPDKGAFEYGGTISPLSVVSRKTHGAAGTFDVDLLVNGNTGVECRSGGASGNHQLILTFANPVTIGSASVTTGTGSVSNTTISGSQVTLDLSGVANAQQIVLTLSGVNDGANSNNVIIPVRVLLADTSGNSTVNASDVSQTKAQIGQATTGSNFRTDVNLSGTITASDVSAVKSKVGTVIPIP